jgi:hypothetical protein
MAEYSRSTSPQAPPRAVISRSLSPQQMAYLKSQRQAAFSRSRSPQAPPPAVISRSLPPQQHAYPKSQRHNSIQFLHPPSSSHSVLNKNKPADPNEQSHPRLPRREQHPASYTPVLIRDLTFQRAKNFSGGDRVLDSKLRPSQNNKSEPNIFPNPRQVRPSVSAYFLAGICLR